MTRLIDEINIHCSATVPTWMGDKSGANKVAEIKRWHVVQNGWADIGYHIIVDRDGKAYHGRSIDRAGAFEPKVNAHAIGVCLIGGYGAAATDAFETHFTPEQDDALRKVIVKLQQQYPGIKRITGHNDYSNKGCPGFNVARWMKRQGPRTSIAQSGTAIGAGTATVAAGGMAVEQVVQAFADTRQAVEEARQVQHDTSAGGAIDPLRIVLVAIILVAAGYALWRRWRDWKAGRK